jgi:hypothetical protein
LRYPAIQRRNQFVHGFFGTPHFDPSSVMPLARRAAANACVAREQCVYTLPSEQPMLRAVSATSISSQ